ncbi:MAG: hypothetical protein M1294_02010 [Firmicutes bacterium]|jgi:hypothetical protein|uniref:Uncharacterized protein n=1 Tax=Sulfobacillus benefaciens TaxID=453960 RepID=A0A2T2WRN3_9FIRM|nr:hypothetical protein [Bacillota bacterium]MCL5012964.1 hypothetical protein [Bacillota bacterium]PSR24888.1 MAG: hypothetical protein C7B43_18000 [Sulfobacillus benefaciens]
MATVHWPVPRRPLRKYAHADCLGEMGWDGAQWLIPWVLEPVRITDGDSLVATEPARKPDEIDHQDLWAEEETAVDFPEEMHPAPAWTKE